MRKIDLMTIIGLIGGTIILFVSILLSGGIDGAKIFISVSSFLTTVGGMIASLLVNFDKKSIVKSFSTIKNVFLVKEEDMQEMVEQFMDLSTTARKNGLLALDNRIEEIEDPFIRKGIMLTVDGLEADVIKEILNAEVIAIEEEQKIGKKILDKAGEMAPAWGMIGTLVGLVLMLRNLDDPKSIGPAMALAIITTLYGSVLANLVFIPMAGKVADQIEKEVYTREIMIEGILGVQSGQNPKLLRDKLEVFVDKTGKKKKEEETASSANKEVAY